MKHLVCTIVRTFQVSRILLRPAAGWNNELRHTPKIRRRHDGSSNKVAVSNGLDIVGVS